MKLTDLKTFRNLLWLLIPLIYISLGTMISVYSSKIPFMDWTRLALSFYGIVMLYLKCPRRGVFNVVTILVTLILLSSLNYYFVENIPTAHSYLDVCDSVMWASILFFAYYISYNGRDAMEFAKFIAFLIPIYTLIFMRVKAYFILNTDDTALISTAYYSLFLLPFALIIKNKFVRWILVLFIFASVLLSSKRGGFIAFWGALSMYFYIELKLKKAASRWKLIISAIGILVAIVLFMNAFIQENDLSIFNRLANMEEDGGSGRDVIYEYTWELIKSSNILYLIFGHGFNTVYHNSVLELSAHTDTLEVIYDYGILGFILYLLFYIKLLAYYKKIKCLMPQYAAPFAATLVLVFVLSMVAHLIIYPTHFLFACLFWGICMGKCDRIIKEKRCLV